MRFLPLTVIGSGPLRLGFALTVRSKASMSLATRTKMPFTTALSSVHRVPRGLARLAVR